MLLSGILTVLFSYFYLDRLFMTSQAQGDIVVTGYVKTVAHPMHSLQLETYTSEHHWINSTRHNRFLWYLCFSRKGSSY